MRQGITLLALALAITAAGCGGGAKTDGSGQAQFGEILSAGSLVGLFQANGLPVGKFQVYNASTDPNKLLGRPGLYTSKANFVDTRIDQSGFAGEKTIDTEQGGSVEVFASEEDAKTAAARRWVSVPAWLMVEIQATCPPDDRTPERRVFQGLTGDSLGNAMERACKAAGIPHYHPHDLRHRYASLKLREGVPVTDLAAQLGHSKKSLTLDTYSHVLVGD